MGESQRRKIAGLSVPKSRDTDGLILRAKQHHLAKDHHAAAAIYQQILSLTPDHPEANQLFGLVLIEIGQYDLGVGYLKRAITLHPNDPVFRFNLGRAHLLAGDPEQAIRNFTEAATLKPDYALAHYNRAATLESMDQHEKAAEAFQLTIAADNQLPKAHAGLARMLYYLDRVPEAKQALECAIRLDTTISADGAMGCAHTNVDRNAVAIAQQQTLRACGNSPSLLNALQQRELAIVDDFILDPLPYREWALSLDYLDRSHGAVNYPGIQTKPHLSEEIMRRICDAIGRDIKWSWPDHGSFRLSFADSKAKSDIHIDEDSGRPIYAGVLYLSLPEYCQGGTAFWRHRETGWDKAPSADEARKSPYRTLKEFQRRRISNDANVSFSDLKQGRGDWDLVLEVPMRFNRLILYRSDYFHSISEVFGDSKQNARLVQLFFFERWKSS
jgi:Flp pilus assembly protein TadD